MESFIYRHWRPRFHNLFGPVEWWPSGRRSPSDLSVCCWQNVQDHRLRSTVTDPNAGSVRSDQLPLLSDVPGHPMAGAVGRSESTLAFTTGRLRMNGCIPEIGRRQTPGSFRGGMSGIAALYHISPIRKLGSFRSDQRPLHSNRSRTYYVRSLYLPHRHQLPSNRP